VRPSRRLRFTLALGFLLAAALPSDAQKPRAPEVFGVDVQLVAVPVFVTTKDGQAVPALTAADFEIEDQGRAVPVAGFLAVDAAAPAVSLSSASPTLTAAARRQFLLLFDLTFSNTTGLLKAREAALDFLQDGPQTGDLVSVASFGPAGVSILLGFSPDRRQAAEAVATLGAAESLRVRDPLGIAYDLGVPLSEGTGKWGLMLKLDDKNKHDPSAFYREQILQMARAERDQYRQRVASYVSDMGRLAQLLDSVQGRKQVILLSGGFDQTVLMGAQAGEQAESSRAVAEGRLWEVQGDRHFGDSEARSGLEDLFTALTRSDTVMHTVDVGGLAAGATGSLDEMGTTGKSSGRETLAQIAGQSGGQFLHDTNDLAGALRDVLDTSRYYYVVAFQPVDSKKKPGDLRKLKIKVKRPGTQVSHRAGYTLPDATAAAGRTRQLQSAEIIAKGLSGGALKLHAAAMAFRNAGGEVSLPVVLEIEGESLVAGEGKKLALEVFGYAFDGEGRVLDVVTLTPTLDLAQVGPLVRQRGVQVLTAFRVKDGPVDLRFLVRDPASSRAGSLRVGATVPSFTDGALVLSAPLLTDDPRTRLVIPTPSKANPNLEIPFRLGETPFTLDAAAVLQRGQDREVCVMARGPVATPAALVAALLREDGSTARVRTGPTRLVPDADGFARLVTKVTPDGAAPGDYVLRLTVRDAGGGEVHAESPVRVN
jgi:VWFA-related protein